MKCFIRASIFWSILTAAVLPAFAQTVLPKPRKYKTTYKMDLYAEADFHSKKLGSIPSDVILESLEETQTYGGYIKVKYKDKTGWLLKAELKRYMDVPAPELACFSNGYKIIGSTYRYFFALRNDGTLPYAGKVTLRLFDKQGKVIHEKTTDFSDSPINPDTGGTFYIDTAVEAPQFELEHKDGKIKSNTGKFIERS